MKLLECNEQEQLEIDVADLIENGRINIYSQVVGRGLFQIGSTGERLVFYASGFVGVLPINENLSIRIRPKFPTRHLDYLVRTATRTPVRIEGFYTDYEAKEHEGVDISEGLIASFVDYADVLPREGILRVYDEEVKELPTPSGRILFAESISIFSRGRSDRIVVAKTVYTTNNSANQIIKSAIIKAAALSKSTIMRTKRSHWMAKLNALYNRFAYVDSISSERAIRQFPKAIDEISRSGKQYYKPALNIARVLLEGHGVTLQGVSPTIAAQSLLFNMDDVFQYYIEAILARVSEHSFRSLDGNKAFPSGGRKPFFDDHPDSIRSSEPATPDYLIVRDNGTGRAKGLPIDAKYKRYEICPGKDDWGQVLGYAITYRSRASMIIHPAANDMQKGIRLIGCVNGISLYCYGFDLDADDLRSEEKQLVDVTTQLAAQSFAAPL